MKNKISVTQIKKELAALHVNYGAFCIISKINDLTVEVYIHYVSWLRYDIYTVVNYLQENYKVEKGINGAYLITTNKDMKKYNFIKVGNVVYWNDPENITSGEYEVVSVPEEIEDDSIILIASDSSEAEVFPTELHPV